MSNRRFRSSYHHILHIFYTKNEVQKKKTLWKDIMQITLQHQLSWVICGDFNSVLSSKHRLGYPFTYKEIQGFQNAIDHL